MVAPKITRAKLAAAHQLFMQHQLSWFAPEALEERPGERLETAAEARLLAILQATGIDGLAVMEMPISLSKRMGTAAQELQRPMETPASPARPSSHTLGSR